jgi:acetyl-CoA acetyltransferase
MGRANRSAFVAGIGMTGFGRHDDRGIEDLGQEACAQALLDAGMSPADVEAAYCGSALGASLQGMTGIGQSVMLELGIGRIPVINVENACATGATALHMAWRDVAFGVHDVVLVVGVDKAVMPKGAVLRVETSRLETQLGDTFPGAFALMAQQHMLRYGTTTRQLAEVSVKNHHNGSLNPLAQFNKVFTREEVLGSAVIADPLTLLSCCPNSDGAAAVVVCARDRLPSPQRSVRIAASVLTSGYYEPMRDLTRWECEVEAARLAYMQSGLGPHEIDCAEVHDAFTISELLHCEGLGFCEPGQSGPMLDSGATRLDGRLPINPSGGLLARGHPPGASGLAQIFELVTQMRGEAGPRQVRRADSVLAQIMGGSKGNDSQACAVHILSRDLDG